VDVVDLTGRSSRIGIVHDAAKGGRIDRRNAIFGM
jgi:hypothetical protein